MKRLAVFAFLGILGAAPAMFGDIEDYVLNINGTTYCPSYTGATCTNNTGFPAGVTSTLDTSYGGTGLGSVKLTFNPGVAGNYNVNLWLFEQVFPPSGQNEYGATGGSPAAGQSWQIDTPDYDLAFDPNTGLPAGAGSIIGNTIGNTLANTNYIPGTLSQYAYNCGPSPNCNDYTSMAMGFNFTLIPGQEEVLDFMVSTTQPSGFYLEQIAPVDGANPTEIDYYYSASAISQPVGVPSTVPEPSMWLPLVALMGVLWLAVRRRRAVATLKRSGASAVLMLLAATVVSLPSMYGASLTVLTVPWVPATPLSPHSTYAINATTEVVVTLQATVPSAVGSSDSFTAQWNFGDGTSSAVFAVTDPYDISVTHQYPASAAVGTAWTATVTVTDTTTSTTGSANFYITQQANTLASRVNVAIDRGLWYMHQTMGRGTTTVGNNTVNVGGWDGGYPCHAVNGATYDCLGFGSINAANVQAFEVSGHYANGPATDPYTDDVARGLARSLQFLASEAVAPDVYEYNPATANFTCNDGSIPGTSDPTCTGHGGQYFYNANATSCTKPPCSITYDGNSNGLMIYSNDNSGEYTYTTSPFMEALIAAGTPNAVATTGPVGVLGETYQTIVQDLADFYNYSQYGSDYDVAQGYTRGGGYSAQGGGWLYGPQQGDDNSTSQWAAIGLISAERGAGIPTPPAVTDFNNVWVTNSQDVQDKAPIGTDPYAAGDNLGSFGYRGSLYYSNAWGSFATTPSGMVQMALDGIGRTANTSFGNPSSAFDQRFNNAETYYADNFCNNTSGGPVNAPRAYSYGLFSFTKSMLLHDPGGVLTPIQYLRTLTPNVFPGNASTGVPVNELDWYGAVSAANGGSDPCDGVAQTLVDLQLNPSNGIADGHWFGNDYDGYQFYYETAWSIIMLNKTVFVSCVNNLAGRGTAAGPGGGQVNLSWSAQTNATGYAVLRSSTSGGPYTQVGTTNLTAYRDGNDGLVPTDTYFYVVQPLQGSTEICQSNQAAVTVP